MFQSLHSDSNCRFPQGGTAEYDYATDVSMADDGSVVMSGRSKGDFTGFNASVSGSSSTSSADLESIFVAIKLDSEGTEVWRWQVRA